MEALRKKAAEKASALLQQLSVTRDDEPEDHEKEESNVDTIPIGSIVLEMECEFVNPMRVAQGIMQLSSTHIYFINAHGAKRQWKLDQISGIFGRR